MLSQWGRTPLYIAVEKGHLDVIRYLENKGAYIDVIDLVVGPAAIANKRVFIGFSE